MVLFCRSKIQYIQFYISRHLLFGMTPTAIHMHSISMWFSKTSEIRSLGAASAITIWLGLLNAILRTAEPCVKNHGLSTQHTFEVCNIAGVQRKHEHC